MKPTDATRATAEAMPEINRRRFLLNTATAGAALAVAVPAVAGEEKAPLVSADIETAWNAVTDARRELVAAKDARDWLADEWRHLWPRSPESMRWNGTGGEFEKDIAGRRYVDQNGYSIGIKTREEIASTKAWVNGRALRSNASERMRDRHEQWKRGSLAKVDEMEAYLAETEKLLETSGSRVVVARLEKAKSELDRAISTLMDVPVTSLTDLHIKARAALIAADVGNLNQKTAKSFPMLGASFAVMLDVLALAEGGEA